LKCAATRLNHFWNGICNLKRDLPSTAVLEEVERQLFGHPIKYHFPLSYCHRQAYLNLILRGASQGVSRPSGA